MISPAERLRLNVKAINRLYYMHYIDNDERIKRVRHATAQYVKVKYGTLPD